MGKGKRGFEKGDPNINRVGVRGKKKMPILKILLEELLGTTETENLRETNLAQVIKALVEVAKDKDHPLMVQAAREVLDRAYGKVTTSILLESGPPIVKIEHNVINHGDELHASARGSLLPEISKALHDSKQG
jgi:hypothetical protein